MRSLGHVLYFIACCEVSSCQHHYDQLDELILGKENRCQFLCIVAMNDLPMSEKGVMMGRMLVYVCSVC